MNCQYLLKYFDDYDYHHPKVEKERLDYRDPNNIVGHIQRAFMVYWTRKCYQELGGYILDIGCGQTITPYAIGVDKVYGVHPAYGGMYKPDIVASGDDLPIEDNCISCIVSNHSIEHMDGKKAFHEWLRVLKPGGIIAFVTPDATYGPIPDPDGHVKEWTPDEFFIEVLLPLIEEDRIELLEIDTFKNNFSWNCVARKKK